MSGSRLTEEARTADAERRAVDGDAGTRRVVRTCRAVEEGRRPDLDGSAEALKADAAKVMEQAKASATTQIDQARAAAKHEAAEGKKKLSAVQSKIEAANTDLVSIEAARAAAQSDLDAADYNAACQRCDGRAGWATGMTRGTWYAET